MNPSLGVLQQPSRLLDTRESTSFDPS